MNNAVWSEKYRPNKLNEVINQRHVVERVKAFVKDKNIPHLLFAGPPGIGKTSVALALANEIYGNEWRQNVLELNASITPDTPIIIRRNATIERTTIGGLASKYFTDSNSKYAYPKDLEILSIDKTNFEIKFLPISNISRHFVDKILKIKTEGGYVKTTLDHSLIVINEGRLQSIKASELKKGDLLITFKKPIESNQKELDLSPLAPNENIQIQYKRKTRLLKNPKVKKIIRKLKITENLAWLFGTYLAEGAIGFKNNTSGVTVFNYGYQQEYPVALKSSSIISNDLGFNTHFHKIKSGSSKKESGLQLTISSTKLARFFKENFYKKGATQKRANYKKIPDFVFNWPIKFRHAFLQGYMGDSTGKWNSYVRYSSSSNEALIDTVWLSRISDLESYYFETESRIIWKLPSCPYVRSELISASPFINFLNKISAKIKFNWRYLLRHQLYSKKSKRVKKQLIKEILYKIDKSRLIAEEIFELENLKKIVTSDLSAIQIKDIKIEDYNGYVYDVSVPNSEMFWGGTLPLLLHNSDARGIDVIRGQVKDFARTIPLGNNSFKVVILDESDNLTADAQNALRRTMEDFTSNCRFILLCNYSSKIIEPIQSRAAVFRFKSLIEDDVRKFIDRIVKGEKLKIDSDAIEALIHIGEGDLRRIANLLQASAALGEKITEDIVYDVSSQAKPEDVKEMLELVLKGKFEESRKKLQDLLLRQGLSGIDIIKEIHRQTYSLKISEENKIKMIEKIGEFEFRLSEGGNDLIQIEALLAQFLLFSKKS